MIHEFKKELRKIEAEMNSGSNTSERKPCKPAVNSDKEDKTLTLLRQLTERLDKLKKDTHQPQQNPGHDVYRQIWQEPQNRRGCGGRGAVLSRGGRGSYRPQRPTAGRTFVPTYFLCNKKGHIQRTCPTILKQNLTRTLSWITILSIHVP